MNCIVLIGLLGSLPMQAADSLNVKIIDRQNHERVYTYLVPGSSTSSSTANLNCYGNAGNVNCSGAARTDTSSTPARVVSYEVTGATFSLQLPDGRIAVVNCGSKAPAGGTGVAIAVLGGVRMNRRSCRIPMVNDLQAEFSGDNAKLKWPVSIDGKKLDSETYKILAVLSKP